MESDELRPAELSGHSAVTVTCCVSPQNSGTNVVPLAGRPNPTMSPSIAMDTLPVLADVHEMGVTNPEIAAPTQLNEVVAVSDVTRGMNRLKSIGVRIKKGSGIESGGSPKVGSGAGSGAGVGAGVGTGAGVGAGAGVCTVVLTTVGVTGTVVVVVVVVVVSPVITGTFEWSAVSFAAGELQPVTIRPIRTAVAVAMWASRVVMPVKSDWPASSGRKC